MTSEESPPEPGDWVLVWAQVADPQQGHPEDLLVRLHSHNEDYLGHIRKDHIKVAHERPDFARRCTRLRNASSGLLGNFLTRCIKHEQHGKMHKDVNGEKWDESESAGYFEER